MKINRIQHRLSLSYLLVLVLSMAMTTVLFLRFARGYVQGRVGEQLRNQAEFVATVLSQSGTLPDASDLPLAMRDFQASFGSALHTRLQIADPQGQVMSDTEGGVGVALPIADLQAALAGSLSPWWALENGIDVMHATAPVQAHGEPIGLVDLSTPLEDTSHLGALRDLLLWAFAGSLLVSLGVSSLLSSTLTRSMARIKNTAQRIAAGELTARVSVEGQDELADLAQAINRMGGDLQNRMMENARERARMSTLLESLADGVVALDGDGRISFLNSAARLILGLGSEDVLHQKLAARWPGTGLQPVLERCTAAGDASTEILIQQRQVQVFAIAYAMPEVLPAPGPPLMLVLRDVTDLRRLEEVRSTFLSSVSHELRTPLTIIKGFAVTLSDSPLVAEDPVLRRSLDVIDGETDRLSRLVDDVLELSRLRSHRMKFECQPLDADEVVFDTVGQLMGKASLLGIRLSVRRAAGCLVMADQDRIQQMVMNLVDNAMKFTPNGGEVVVETSCPPGYWELRVIDTGLGIAPDDLPYLFERFFRGQDGRKKGIAGTGLGLAIVKELVDLHGGDIQVESKLEKGTLVRIKLPAAHPG